MGNQVAKLYYADPLVSAFYELPNVEEGTDSGAGGAGVYWFPTLST